MQMPQQTKALRRRLDDLAHAESVRLAEHVSSATLDARSR